MISAPTAIEVGIEVAVRAAAGAAGGPRITSHGPGWEPPATIRGVRSTDADPWNLFTAEPGQLLPEGDVLLVGLGSAGDDPEPWRLAGETAGEHLPDIVRIELPPASSDCVRAFLAGLWAGADPDRHHEIDVPAELAGPAGEAVALGDAIRLTRVLVNAPPNVLTPESLERWALLLADGIGARYQVLHESELREQGWGCLLAVGSGSSVPPRAVVLRRGDAERPDLTFVGKGVTFDSGGLSLKPPADIRAMRNDMTGVATVLATLAVLARTGSDLTVELVLPIAENMPGGTACRPGDVVSALDGTQVQIMDTDFEGRLILADALTYASRREPAVLVDVATLTYQAVVALGQEIGAFFGNEEASRNRLEAAARSAGEALWRLPLARRYLRHMRTAHGLRNHPMNDTGRAITAALFLERFVARDVPWVHLDIAGPTWRGDASGDGATGFGVATLVRFADSLGREKARPQQACSYEQLMRNDV